MVFHSRILFCALVSHIHTWFLCVQVLSIIKRHTGGRAEVEQKILGPQLWRTATLAGPPESADIRRFGCRLGTATGQAKRWIPEQEAGN